MIDVSVYEKIEKSLGFVFLSPEIAIKRKTLVLVFRK